LSYLISGSEAAICRSSVMLIGFNLEKPRCLQCRHNLAELLEILSLETSAFFLEIENVVGQLRRIRVRHRRVLARETGDKIQAPIQKFVQFNSYILRSQSNNEYTRPI